MQEARHTLKQGVATALKYIYTYTYKHIYTYNFPVVTANTQNAEHSHLVWKNTSSSTKPKSAQSLVIVPVKTRCFWGCWLLLVLAILFCMLVCRLGAMVARLLGVAAGLKAPGGARALGAGYVTAVTCRTKVGTLQGQSLEDRQPLET